MTWWKFCMQWGFCGNRQNRARPCFLNGKLNKVKKYKCMNKEGGCTKRNYASRVQLGWLDWNCVSFLSLTNVYICQCQFKTNSKHMWKWIYGKSENLAMFQCSCGDNHNRRWRGFSGKRNKVPCPSFEPRSLCHQHDWSFRAAPPPFLPKSTITSLNVHCAM